MFEVKAFQFCIPDQFFKVYATWKTRLTDLYNWYFVSRGVVLLLLLAPLGCVIIFYGWSSYRGPKLMHFSHGRSCCRRFVHLFHCFFSFNVLILVLVLVSLFGFSQFGFFQIICFCCFPFCFLLWSNWVSDIAFRFNTDLNWPATIWADNSTFLGLLFCSWCVTRIS